MRHPRVGLREDPVRPDAVGKGIAGDHEFGRDDPGRAEFCGGVDRRLDKASVPGELARDRREVEERDTQCVWRHILELSGWDEPGRYAFERNTGERTRDTLKRSDHP